MAARRRTRSDALEPAILDAAESLLEEAGPDGLSIRKIADRAKVAPMGLYTRFDGKHGVVDELFKVGFVRLAAVLREATSTQDPAAGLAEAALAYRRLALEHPARYQLMFLRAVPGYLPSHAALETVDAARSVLADAVRRRGERGALRVVDPDDAAGQLWAAWHGWVALELCGLVVADDPGGYERLVDLVLRGLAA